MIWIYLQLFGLGVLVLLSGLFSSSEVAYTGLSLSQLKRVRRFNPRVLRFWEKQPDRVLATLLISNNAVNAGVGVLVASMGFVLAERAGWPNSVVTMLLGVLSSIIVLVFGEIIPKIWAKRYNVSWALTVTPFMRVWTRLISPIARAAAGIVNTFLFGRSQRFSKQPFMQPSELKHILTHSTLPQVSRRILHNVMEFNQEKAGDVMTHRSDIFAVSFQQPLEKMIASIIQSGYSRVPVYFGSLDNIRGVLYAKDLLVAWRSGRLILMEDLIRPVHRVTMDTPVSELMRFFRKGRHHLAVVIDPKNPKKLQGLVTIQDTLETIVGDIREEV